MPLTPSEMKHIQQSQDYLQKHGISKLFNEIMAILAYHRPANPKEYILNECLKHAKVNGETITLKDTLFKKDDFDEMFNMYDAIDQKSVSYTYLIQALSAVGVMDAKKYVSEKHPEITLTSVIGKKIFSTVLDAAHKLVGFESLKQ